MSRIVLITGASSGYGKATAKAFKDNGDIVIMTARNQEKLEKARKHGLVVSKYEEKNPDMLHAKLGSYYARYKYDVVDQDILDAIAYHTTGRPNMSILEKIIFVLYNSVYVIGCLRMKL